MQPKDFMQNMSRKRFWEGKHRPTDRPSANCFAKIFCWRLEKQLGCSRCSGPVSTSICYLILIISHNLALFRAGHTYTQCESMETHRRRPTVALECFRLTYVKFLLVFGWFLCRSIDWNSDVTTLASQMCLECDYVILTWRRSDTCICMLHLRSPLTQRCTPAFPSLDGGTFCAAWANGFQLIASVLFRLLGQCKQDVLFSSFNLLFRPIDKWNCLKIIKNSNKNNLHVSICVRPSIDKV